MKNVQEVTNYLIQNGLDPNHPRVKIFLDRVVDFYKPDEEPKTNPFKDVNWKGITYIKPLMKIYFKATDRHGRKYDSYRPLYLFKCNHCGNNFVTFNKKVKSYEDVTSCRVCSNTVSKTLFGFIPIEYREKFIDMCNNMHARCYSPVNPRFYLYSSKGITVYDEWRVYNKEGLSIEDKIEHMRNFYNYCINIGWKPGLEIDRIDNEKGYFPGNIRFVNSSTNSNNRNTTVLIEFRGMKKK